MVTSWVGAGLAQALGHCSQSQVGAEFEEPGPEQCLALGALVAICGSLQSAFRLGCCLVCSSPWFLAYVDGFNDLVGCPCCAGSP